ncbi:MAG TPA: hypothetical protein VMT88_04320 [Actinomycetes bacterium]|nr:hypothetical protein [Actinomycetes bacterium]
MSSQGEPQADRAGPTRRKLLMGLAAGGATWAVGACSSTPRGPAVGQGSRTPTGSRRSPTDSPTGESLPPTKPWQANPADVSPQVKLRAARLIEVVGAWPEGEGGRTAAMRRAQTHGYDPRLVSEMTPLLPDAQSAVVEVVNAQYGGILPTSASVLLVVNQWFRHDDGVVAATGTTVDVRLDASSAQWGVTAVRPANPAPRENPISVTARRLLANDRVRLPFAARADVQSGGISDAVLRALSLLSREHMLDVSVLQSGHPIRVFGTDRRSDHADGRAADIWAIDGRLVIEQNNRHAVVEVMRAAVTAGAYQVGGPVNLDGAGTTYFSDATHQDHIHMGFTT